MKTPKRQPTTVYFLARIARAAKVKAALMGRSLSDLVNDAVALALREDEIDLRSFDERRHEPEKSYEEVLKGLKRDGLL